MCRRCADPTAIRSMSVPRRDFLACGGAAMASLALARDGFAEAPKAPPKKENVLSPEAAKRLMTAMSAMSRGFPSATISGMSAKR